MQASESQGSSALPAGSTRVKVCHREVQANAHSSKNYDGNSTTIYLWSRKLPANSSFLSRCSGSKCHFSCRNRTEIRLPADFVPTGAGIDVLVLLDDVKDTRRESVRPRAALPGIAMAADVVVTAMQRFAETKHVGGGFGACLAGGAGAVGGCRPTTITSAGRAVTVRRSTVSSRCWSASTTRIMALTSSSFQVGARPAGAAQLLAHAPLAQVCSWRPQ